MGKWMERALWLAGGASPTEGRTVPAGAPRNVLTRWRVGELVRVQGQDGRVVYAVVQGDAEEPPGTLLHPGVWYWVLAENGDRWVHESFVKAVEESL